MHCAVIVEDRDSFFQKALKAHEPYLPDKVFRITDPCKSAQAYNEIMTSMSFWNRFSDYERILVFQHDSGLLKPIDDDLWEWDYVGAPWPIGHCDRPDRKGGNGGFSIRGPEAHIRLLENAKWHSRYGNEDVWFVHNLDRVGGQIAPYEVCKRFSVEADYHLGSCGYHQIESWLTDDQIKRIYNQYE